MLSNWTFLLNFFSSLIQLKSGLVWFLYPDHIGEAVSSFAFLDISNMEKKIYDLDIARIISQISQFTS